VTNFKRVISRESPKNIHKSKIWIRNNSSHKLDEVKIWKQIVPTHHNMHGAPQPLSGLFFSLFSLFSLLFFFFFLFCCSGSIRTSGKPGWNRLNPNDRDRQHIRNEQSSIECWYLRHGTTLSLLGGIRRGGSRDVIRWLRIRLYGACVSPGMRTNPSTCRVLTLVGT